MKEVILKNKKIIIIVAVVIICILIVIGVFALVSNGDNKSQKEILTARMEELGKSFYEDFYYKQVGKTDEERAEFLKKYEKIGFKISVENLARYNADSTEEILAEFVNEKTKKACDTENSQVIIYPKSPYDQVSYEMEVNLECGFDEE